MIVTHSHRGNEWQIEDVGEFTRYVLDRPEWETETFDYIDEHVNGGVFVDVGAWVGLMTLHASTRASQVYALEPDPTARGLLERNLALNDVENVTVLPVALWDHDGSLTLHQQSEWGDSMTGPTREGPSFDVECISVATLRTRVGCLPDLVKVDTEGSEGHILPELLTWPCPLLVAIHAREMDVPLDLGERPYAVYGSVPAGYYSVAFR